MRKLLLTTIVALALAAPAGAGAAGETHSLPQVGHLTVDMQQGGATHFHWSTLHFLLHTCDSNQGSVGGCHWTLYGRVNPRWGRCPETDSATASGYTSTFFADRVTDGSLSLTAGRGSVVFPATHAAYGQYLACWYVQIDSNPHASLAARTIIPL